VATTHAATLLADGAPPLLALTAGFDRALWACCAIAVVAVPVALLVPRRQLPGTGAGPAVAVSQGQGAS
jgi:hypothetical protein